jgi:hypothetical protein
MATRHSIRRRSIWGFMATLVFTLLLGGGAQAGVVWCVKDPIFVIDGRVAQVQDLVPVQNANAPLHFQLRVAKGSVVSWHLPEGETLLGSVTIVVDDDVSRDAPRLSVQGEGKQFPMRLIVSGSGLRGPSYEVQGTSRGLTVGLRLVALPRLVALSVEARDDE